jgi:hypothetical protein
MDAQRQTQAEIGPRYRAQLPEQRMADVVENERRCSNLINGATAASLEYVRVLRSAAVFYQLRMHMKLPARI